MHQGDAMVQVLDGTARITIGDTENTTSRLGKPL
jgi:hypothetical protein